MNVTRSPYRLKIAGNSVWCIREQNGHSKSSKLTTTTLADLAPREGRPVTSILLITSAKGSLLRSNRVTRNILLRSLDTRNLYSFDLPSSPPMVTATASYPATSVLGVIAPTVTFTSGGMV